MSKTRNSHQLEALTSPNIAGTDKNIGMHFQAWIQRICDHTLGISAQNRALQSSINLCHFELLLFPLIVVV
ncbi:MAG: hypothetical protein JKX81_06210 [Arenicella sp.]|nr:hypothetical protein [Arenicella sp.]